MIPRSAKRQLIRESIYSRIIFLDGRSAISISILSSILARFSRFRSSFVGRPEVAEVGTAVGLVTDGITDMAEEAGGAEGAKTPIGLAFNTANNGFVDTSITIIAAYISNGRTNNRR